MAMIVSVESVNDGLYTVKIKREIGTGRETREFTRKALEEYLDGAEEYCKMKGYEFIFEGNDLLPQWGGQRENAGRPSVGATKKVSLTLPDEVWEKIAEDKEEEGISQSALLRSIVEKHYGITTEKLKKQL